MDAVDVTGHARLLELDITDNNSIKDLQILSETCKIVSNYSVVGNVNTFGRVCIFNTDAGATYYVAWNEEKVSHSDAQDVSETKGMYLPKLSQAEEIASRIQNIRRVLNIEVDYLDQSFWTGTNKSSSGPNFYYFIYFSNDFSYETDRYASDSFDDFAYFSVYIN